MQIFDYIQERDATVARKTPDKYTRVAGDPDMRVRLERLTGLMLEHFLPQLRGRDVSGIVDGIFRNQECAAYESSPELGNGYLDLLGELIQVESAERLAQAFSKRSLYCAFHIDSYRLIMSYLRYQSERPVGLLVTPDVIQAQQAQINALGASIMPDMQERTNIQLFDAESFEGLGDAIRFLGKGGLLVIYIDGNSGFGGMSARHKSMVRIPFLGGQIMARLGVAQLSSRLGMPIVPLHVENLDNGRRILHCLPALPPPAQGQREAQIDTTRQLYAILEERIRRKPECWEGWLYINRFMELLPADDLDPAAGPANASTPNSASAAVYDKLDFAHQAYTLLPYPGQTVLMCKRRLSYQLVSKAAVEVLMKAFQGPVDARTVAPLNIISELIRIGALVPSSAQSSA